MKFPIWILLAGVPLFQQAATLNLDPHDDSQDLDVPYNLLATDVTEEENISYEKLSAAQKKNQLWKDIIKTQYHVIPPYEDTGASKLQLFNPLFAIKAFTHGSDTMIKDRKKHIHSSGSVIQVRFDAEKGHPYTGLFETGAKEGLLRISLAKAPEKNSYLPGFGLKFLIDGQASKNIMAMYSLDGQSSPHIFENTFSNVIEPPHSFAAKALEKSFALGLKSIGCKGKTTALTTKHMASVTENGNSVSEIKAPYRLRFVPSEELKAMTANLKEGEDFRKVINGKGEGLHLYTVIGEHSAQDECGVYSYTVGHIHASSNFIASEFGDHSLYFQHQKTE